MTGEEIQRRLVDFGRRWSLYDGSERAEAQTFLNELFACYGTNRHDAGASFEAAQEGRYATNAFALDTDFAMGVLTSRVHTDWAAAKSSTLEDRIRYTPSSAFETFPWPQASKEDRAKISEAARQTFALRSTLCAEHEIGLTTLYNRLGDGAFEALRSAHRVLDLAVVAAFGWEQATLDDVRERNRLLYELNSAIVREQVPYEPF